MTKPPFLYGLALGYLVLTGSPLPGAAQLVDKTSGLLVTTGNSFGVAWGDFDKDGDFDLLMAKSSQSSKLLRNDGLDLFSDVTSSEIGGEGGDVSPSIIDYDDDGDLDIYVANSISASRMLRNDNGTFVPVTAGDVTGTTNAQSAAWSDYDKDGDLDLFVTCWAQPDHLYRNDGNGILHDATPVVLADPGNNTGAAWGDFDNDHDPDLYVGGRVSGHLYRNDAGTFVDVTDVTLAKAGVNGVAWGDEDGDGDLDLYLARDLNSSRLLRNDSTPGVVNFTDMYIVAVRDPGRGQGTAWVDYDSDGDLDIFLAKAGVDNASGSPNALFRNNGGDSFSIVSAGPVLDVANSRGVACGDYDGNGAPDLYVANWGSSNQLLAAAGAGHHWIEVHLIGTESNSQGIGARVRIVSGGGTHHIVREISGGSGIYSQNAPVVLAGLYVDTVVDSIQVTWPSGIVTDTTNLAIQQIITMQETQIQTGIGDGPHPGVARLLAASPNPFRAGTTIAYELSRTSPVRLLVLDPQGRLMRVLESTQSKEPGRYSERWDGRNEAGREVAPGVYFYSLTTSRFRQSFPIILVR
jgi:ASPIC and UnbV/FG-GAP-like repeat/FlgD Ig-like domain